MLKILKELYQHFSSKYQNVFLDYPVDFAPRYDKHHGPHDLLHDIINQNRDAYIKLLHTIGKYQEPLSAINQNQSGDILPYWNNDFLPALDIAILYTMISNLTPAKYIEVGSGTSTKVAALAIRDYSPQSQIVSIDPQPRAEISSIVDHVIKKPFETIDFFKEINIESGDILFIDNSHRVLPNSDVTVLFLEILPKLPTGVIVHFHDIYLPYDYPQFMCDRFYSEQYMLAAYILNNPTRYHTLCPNYFISEDAELKGVINHLWNIESLSKAERHGGSYWIQIR